MPPASGTPSSAAAGEGHPFRRAAVNAGTESPNATERQPARGLAGAMEEGDATARDGPPPDRSSSFEATER
jgi:hypothetical protein